METYIDRIKQLKTEQKLTNDQLAEKSGIPLGTLSKILAGMSESPKLSNILALCDALDCSIEYIVSGTPENTNNYTLNAPEIRLIEDYRRLDRYGRELVELVLHKEAERISDHATDTLTRPETSTAEKRAKVLAPIRQSHYTSEMPKTGKRAISLFELPVSAGVGVYLDEEIAERISIPNNEKTADADYALRISGNSMEPKYHNEDILLVQSCDSIEVGELGIFLLDGCGYFKVYGGDRLLSLNPEYGPIMLKDFADIQCKGRIVGKLKRK